MSSSGSLTWPKPPKHALCTLKMQDYQHVNKYMIEFSKHATHMGLEQCPLTMVSSIEDLLKHIKDQLVSLECPTTFQQFKFNALKVQFLLLEMPRQEGAPTSWNQQSSFGTTPSKTANYPSLLPTDTPKPAKSSTGNQFGAAASSQKWNANDDMLGICYYCALSIDGLPWTVETPGIPSTHGWSGHICHHCKPDAPLRR